MPHLKLVDTFGAFLSFWERVEAEPLAGQLEDWSAEEFLRRIDAGEDMRPFFGSWHDLCEYKQTGYFLGHEFIKAMQARASLREIALIEEPARHLRLLLTAMAG